MASIDAKITGRVEVPRHAVEHDTGDGEIIQVVTAVGEGRRPRDRVIGYLEQVAGSCRCGCAVTVIGDPGVVGVGWVDGDSTHETIGSR